MSIVPSFDTGALRIRLKTAEDKVKAFESGEKYVQMQEQFKAVFREQNARIRKQCPLTLSRTAVLNTACSCVYSVSR